MEIQTLQDQWIEGPHKRPIVYDLIYRPTGRPKPIVVFAHGFKGFKDWGPFPLVGRAFAEQDLVFIKFNFSHNGGTLEQPIDFPDLEAFGQNNHSKELDDLGRIIDAVVNERLVPGGEGNPEALYLLGHSRGGGACILKAGEDARVRKLVTWSAVSDLQSRVPTNDIEQWRKDGVIHIPNARTEQQMPMYYQYYEDLVNNAERLDIERAARSLDIPWLIVHGEADETVPRKEAEDLQEWNGNAELMMVPGTGHTFGGKHPHEGGGMPSPMDRVVERSIDFIASQQG